MSSTLAQYQAQANPQDWATATALANQYNIPTNIFLALVAQESSWNPNAQSPNSSSYGYTQLTSGTAQDLGVNQYTVAGNLQGGAEYLAQMYAKFGSWTDALIHYNQGPNATSASALAAGTNYANSVMAIANSGAAPAPSPAAGSASSTTVSDANATPGWVSSILDWIKSQLGNVAFLLIGGALIIVALLFNDTVRQTAGDAAKAAVVA